MIETSQLLIRDKGNNNNNKNSSKDKFFLEFPTRKWFKDRMGTLYSGYSDPRLLSLLIDQAKHLTEEEKEQLIIQWK